MVIHKYRRCALKIQIQFPSFLINVKMIIHTAFGLIYLRIALSMVLLDKRSIEPSAPEIKCSLVRRSTQVGLKVQNTGPESIRLLQSGTILDPRPIEKVDVYTHSLNVKSPLSKKLPFKGLQTDVSTSHLSDLSFLTLHNNEDYFDSIDLPDTYNLPHGEKVIVHVNTVIPYASHGSNELIGTVPCESNWITFGNEIGGEELDVPGEYVDPDQKEVPKECPKALKESFEHCQDLSRAAIEAVQNKDNNL